MYSPLLLLLLAVSAQSNFSSKLSLRSLLLEEGHHLRFDSTTVCATEAPVIKPEVVANVTNEENPSVGNCTNNLTNPSSITHVPLKVQEAVDAVVPPSTEDAAPKQPIVTFDEWTKEKLKQEQRKSNPPSRTNHPTPTATPANPTNGRNYASKECGAKVLMSNAEAENTKAVLNDKEQDEYMRNPCAKAENKFVVVELCETIQPSQIILGNLELFSSGPREFQVWAAERAGADWQLLGNFTAADSRQQQTFKVTNRVYAKLVKLELLSHYGNEHYCTLSVMKVLGISMVDEYEIEAEAAVRRPVVVETVAPTQRQEQPATGETTTASPKTEEPVVEATTATPRVEQKPIVREIVDQVVSGTILKTIVSAVADKLKGEVSEKPAVAKFKPFDMSLCQVCPVNPSCIVPTHLCWVFVWRPPKRNQTIPHTPPGFPVHRSMSERRRRRRIAFHQRQLAKAKETVQTTIEAPPVEATTPAPESVEVPPSPPPAPVVQSQDAIPASSTSHKESVFMKLNKRIAALELNMSLSSEYLSELSRQYVSQTDEHKRHLEQARRAAQEVAEEVENRLNKAISERMTSMKKEMDALSDFLNSLRVAASEPSLSRFNWYSQFSRDKCGQEEEDMTDIKRYIAKVELDLDGLWTTEQVMYVVVTAQVVTAVIMSLLVCYTWLRKKPSPDNSQLKQFIQEQVQQILQAKESVVERPVEESDPPASKKGRRRRRNRGALEPAGDYPSSDSAVSRTTETCQTETSSEAENARAAAALDTTLRPSSPQQKSEDEEPWIPVKRKTSSHSRT